MFGFFSKNRKRKSYFVDFSKLAVDIHSHLIPGIDDGAKDMDDSLGMIQRLSDLGFKKLITTPHTYFEFYPNTTQILKSGLEEVRAELGRRHLDYDFDGASEYFMDEHFEEKLQKKDLLTLDGQHVLVEMSFFGKPPKLKNYLFEMQMMGYKPVLAHPERYIYLGPTTAEFAELKNRGCKLQLNLLSLTGHYGEAVKDLAETILEEGLYDFAGTDCHRHEHIDKILTLTDKSNIDITHKFQNDIFL